MHARTLELIQAHAVADYPRECCGLMVAVGRSAMYVRCRNLAVGTDQFHLSPEDWAKAEDLGPILAVVHSHPDAPAVPSEGDRVACEASGLPWLIVSVRADSGVPVAGELHRMEPTGFRAPLVGRNFHHGVLDCYTLIRDYFEREQGIAIPDFARSDDWWHAGEDLYMRHFADAGFVAQPPAATLAPGDVILMQVRARVANHAGVFIGGSTLKDMPDLWPVPDAMLHHLHGRLSERTVYGGYWRDCTRLVVRHHAMQASALS